MFTRYYYRNLLPAVVILMPLTLAVAQAGEGQSVIRRFAHDGYNRRYKLYIPAAYDGQEAWPLVISFHGQTFTIAEGSHPRLDGMRAVADTAHFLLAYPQGLNTPQPEYPNTPGWNVHGGFGDWDDVEFTSRLIDHISADYRVDPARIHATGFSHGTAMSFALACRLADRIASMGAVSGPLPDVYFSDCPADRSVATLLFHGTADPIHPMTGYLPGNYMTIPVPETPLFWAKHNNCSLEPTKTDLPDVDTHDNTTVTLIEYPNCDEDTEVQFYRINGGGHIWPGRVVQSASAGNGNMDVDASTIIWEFFARHPHPDPANDYYYLSRQEAIDAFPDDITEIPHYLWIGNSSDITNLSPLSAITSLAGDLVISANEQLASLEGLASIATVGETVTILSNPLLNDLDGLSSLTSVGELEIVDNDALLSLDGLLSLKTVTGRLSIIDNDALKTMSGLYGQTSFGSLTIADNDRLRSLQGLPAFASMGSLSISGNPVLDDLKSLSPITAINGSFSIDDNDALSGLASLSQLTTITGSFVVEGNDGMLSLDGPSALDSVGGRLSIRANDAMTNLDGLSNLTAVGRDLEVSWNDALNNLDGLSGLKSIGGRLTVRSNGVLESCSCGLYDSFSSGGISGSISMARNAESGDCNSNGADLVADACFSSWNATKVGYLPIPDFNLTEVDVSENLATVSSPEWRGGEWGQSGVWWLIDLNDPTSPTRLTSSDSVTAGAIVVRGGRGFVVVGHQSTGVPVELHIFDVSDPGSPVKLGELNTQGDGAVIAARGDYVYLALENSEGLPRPPGLLIVDVSDPSNPTEVSFMETTPTDHMVFTLVDDLAYLSSPDGFGSMCGLHILDVSDRAQPRQVLFTEQWGGHGLAVDGSLLLVRQNWEASWDILDVSDPSNPDSLGELALTTSNSVELSGDRAYVAAGADGLRVFDLSDRSNPTEVAFFVTQGEANDVAVAGDLAYVVASDGLFVIETHVVTSVEGPAVGEVPGTYVLHQNYPNPFNPATTITYDLPEATDVRLTVFDALGRTVEIFGTRYQVPGTYSVQFDASRLPSGIYFYRLEAGDYSETKSLVLAK